MWVTFLSGPNKDRTLQLPDDRIVVGRSQSCDLLLADERVSRKHASFRVLMDGRIVVQDLGSMNGTYLNGRRIQGPALLLPDDQLQLGDTLLKASITQPASAPAPPSPLPPPGPRAPGPATIERQILGRTAPRAATLSVAALVAAVVLGGALLVMFLGGRDEAGTSPTPSALPSVPQIIQAVRPSVVLVTSLLGGRPFATGTGWVLDADEGLIVTNAHVVNGGTSFTIGVVDERRTAELVGVAPCEDLAVLRVQDTDGLRTMQLGSQAALRQGETVVALGFPASAAQRSELAATVGVVSVVETMFRLRALDVPQYPNVIQTDAAINPGNSGGPLVNEEMQLVGVNSAGITLLGGRTIQGQGYAIGVDRVKEIVAILRAGESIGWTGMSLAYPGLPRLRRLGFPPTFGLLVTTVAPGSPAAQAGFGRGPLLITRIDGRRTPGTLPSYCDVVGEAGAGDSAVFTVLRPGRSGSTDVRVSFG